MANTISNFLVGVGFDFDERTTKKVTSELDGVKRTALQVGAVLAGAFGFQALTFGFAGAADEIGKFAEVYGSSANQIGALGRALEHEGGTLSGLMSQLKSLEEVRAAILVGDASVIRPAEVAGIDTSQILNASNAAEAYLDLADQFQRMTAKQRINAAKALGLDDASVRLLSMGSDAVRDMVYQQQQIRPIPEDNVRAAREFNDAWIDITNNIGGVADKVSGKLLPAMTKLITATNDWFAANRAWMNQGVDKALEAIADNATTLGIVLAGIATAGTLGTLSKIADIVPVIGGSVSALAASLSVVAGAMAGIAASIYAIEQFASPRFKEEFGVDPKTVPDIFALGDMITKQQEEDAESGVATITDGGRRASGRVPPIQINLNLDGRVIDRRVIDVNNSLNNQALDALSGSTGG